MKQSERASEIENKEETEKQTDGRCQLQWGMVQTSLTVQFLRI